MAGRLQPAFWGGLFIGVLSALPVINLGNCCCCLWVVVGGALATYLRQQNTPMQVTASEGALVGLMAGAIGGVIWVMLAIPLQMMTAGFQQHWVDQFISGNPDMPAEMRDVLEQISAGGVLNAVAMLVNIIASVVFGMLGGLLGVAIFKKNVPPPPPPGTIEVLPPAQG